MDRYQFWLLNEADERTQGLDLPCAAEQEAWLVAERLLAECRRVEIWAERELIGRLGVSAGDALEVSGFVWPAKPSRRPARGRSKTTPPRRPPRGAKVRQSA